MVFSLFHKEGESKEQPGKTEPFRTPLECSEATAPSQDSQVLASASPKYTK